MRRVLVVLIALAGCATTTAGWCGILLPHVVRGSVNLRPQTCIAPHHMVAWRDRAYMTGASTSGAGPTVWAVDVSNPDEPRYLSSNGVGFKAYGAMASGDGRLYVASWFEGLRIYDINTGMLSLVGVYDPPEGAFWELDVQDDRVYLAQGTETTSDMQFIDISNPAAPAKLNYFDTDLSIGGVAARGSYLYYAQNHFSGRPEGTAFHLAIRNISDETNPYLVSNLVMPHSLGGFVLRGNYLYATWGDAGWNNYGGGTLPSADTETAWNVIEGSETWAGANGGILRVNDTSTAAGSKVRWSRPWYADPAYGTTVRARLRCASAGGDTTSICNISVEDGARSEIFVLLPDRLVAVQSGESWPIDATQWHVYSITTRGTEFRVYVDDNRSPVITGPLVGTTTRNRITFGGGADAATQDIYIDYISYTGKEAIPPDANGGLDVFDISDPTNPRLVGEYAGVGGNGPCMLGDYIFYTTSGNGFMTIDVSDPTNPHPVAQSNMDGYELAIAGNGRYLYIGNLAGDWEGCLYTLEAFDSDPDTTPPPKWSAFSLGDASWDVEYLADQLPPASDPEWAAPPGSVESQASTSGGVLRVNDDSASAKTYWVRNWNATNTRGATVLARARCASYDLNGASIGTMNNIIIEDGKYEEDFVILPDRIRANKAGVEYPMDGTQWHTYRITTKGNGFCVYVDEQPTPVLTGALSATTNRARVWLGSTSTIGKQDICFDFVQCCSDGVYGPASRINDQTPDLSVAVSDFVTNDSVSGIDPSSARYYWSTDGGVSWNPAAWDCRYEGGAMPSAASPAWTVAEGDESCASVESELLHVSDTSTAPGSKIKWSRDWNARPSSGTTVLALARCAATGGDTFYTGNIFVEDGVHQERFKIMTDRIVAAESGHTYMLDGTQWHVYRITTKGNQFRVYVDESPAPVMAGTMTATTGENRVMFGSGASAGTQDIYFDYVYYTAVGDLAPGQAGGAGQPATCTEQPGDYNALITATEIPFDQYSETLNKVKFAVRDMAGNMSYSPVYNVRIDPNAGPTVINVTSTKPDGVYKQGDTINIQVVFSTPVFYTGTPQIRLAVKPGGKLVNCTGGSGTDTLSFTYTVGAGEASPDLTYTDIDAVNLPGGATIRDAYASDASIRLPDPGAAGSLSANKDIVIDSVRPRVTSVSSDNPDGAYGTGSTISVTAYFSEAVTVTGTPLLELETGATDRKASYVSGSGSTVLVFSYVVQQGDASEDLDYKATSSLTGTVKDAAGNFATLTLPAPGAAGSLAYAKNLVIDTVAPTAAAVSAPSVTLARTGPVSYTVDFSEPVVGFDSDDDVRVDSTGEAAAGSVSVTGSGAGPYVVTLSQITGEGTLGITIKQGACTDAAGNPNIASSPSATFRVLARDGSIAAAKLLEDGASVDLGNKALYLVREGFGYIEEPDRSCGIRIEGTITASEGELVCLAGVVRTAPGGERYIRVSEISPAGPCAVDPLGASNYALKDALMEGLYVKAWGVVKPGSITGGSYVISDGSDTAGIRVLTPGAPEVSEGEYVTVTGAAGREGARVIHAK